MSFFEIDYLQKMTDLLKEAFLFKKYKAMNKILAVFTGIFMLPIVIASFFAVAWFASLAFLFSIFSAPVKYLHEIVRDEGKEVKQFTQLVVYLISWPTVFSLYVLMSFLLILLIPAYALLSFLLYVWSLGGFKFHLRLNKIDDLSIEVNQTYFALPLVFIVLSCITAISAPLIHGIILYADLYQDYLEHLFLEIFFVDVFPIYIWGHSMFATLYSLLGFARRSKKEEKEEIE